MNSSLQRSQSQITISKDFFALPAQSHLNIAHPLQIFLTQMVGTFIFFAPSLVQVFSKEPTASLDVQLFLYVAVTVCILFSGAHLNPMVSVIMCIKRELRVSVKKLPFYFLGQFLGAFLAILYVIYYLDADVVFAPLNSTGQYIKAGLGQCIGVMLLVWLVLVLTNPNTAMTMDQAPSVIMICAGVFICRSFTPISGESLNLAGSLNLALVTVFRGKECANILPWLLGDLVGGFLGWGLFEWTLSLSKRVRSFVQI